MVPTNEIIMIVDARMYVKYLCFPPDLTYFTYLTIL